MRVAMSVCPGHAGGCVCPPRAAVVPRQAEAQVPPGIGAAGMRLGCGRDHGVLPRGCAGPDTSCPKPTPFPWPFLLLGVPWVGADSCALGPRAGGSLGPAPGKLKRTREPLVCMEGTRNPHRGRTGAVPRRLVSAGQRVCATGQGRSCGVLWDSGLLPAPSLSSPRCAEHLRFAGRCWAKHGAEGRGSGCCCQCRDLGLPHLPSPVFIVAALLLAVPMTGSTLSRWPDRLCRYICRAAGPRERCRYLRRAPGAVPVPLQGCRAPGAVPAAPPAVPRREPPSASPRSPRAAVLNRDLVAVPRVQVGGWPCRALRARTLVFGDGCARCASSPALRPC